MHRKFLRIEQLEERRFLTASATVSTVGIANVITLPFGTQNIDRDVFISELPSSTGNVSAVVANNTFPARDSDGTEAFGQTSVEGSASWFSTETFGQPDAFGNVPFSINGRIDSLGELTPGHTYTSGPLAGQLVDSRGSAGAASFHRIDFNSVHEEVRLAQHYLQETSYVDGVEVRSDTQVLGITTPLNVSRFSVSASAKPVNAVPEQNASNEYEYHALVCNAANIGETETVFLDADNKFSPESNWISLTGMGRQGENIHVDFIEDPVPGFAPKRLLQSSAVTVDDEGFWEVVLLVPESAAEVAIRTAENPCHVDIAEVTPSEDLPIEGLTQFSEQIKSLKTGDVITTVGSSASSAAQRNLHGGTYSHAQIYIGGDVNGTPKIVEALKGKLSESKSIDAGLQGVESFDVFRKEGLEFSQRQSIAGAAEKLIGIPYWTVSEDWVLLTFAATRFSQQPDPFPGLPPNQAENATRALLLQTERLICSTLVWHAYENGLGIDLSGGSTSSNERLGGLGVVPDGFVAYLESQGSLVLPDTLAASPQLTKVELSAIAEPIQPDETIRSSGLPTDRLFLLSGNPSESSKARRQRITTDATVNGFFTNVHPELLVLDSVGTKIQSTSGEKMGTLSEDILWILDAAYESAGNQELAVALDGAWLSSYL